MGGVQTSSSPLVKNEAEISRTEPTEEIKEEKSEKEQEPSFRSMEDSIREYTGENRMSDEDYARYRPLVLASLRGYWEKVEHFISENPDALTAIINEGSETFFHLMAQTDKDGAIQLLDKYIKRVPPKFLEQKHNFGATALGLAATIGNVRAAKLLVEANENLPKMKVGQYFPLHYAAYSGHRETVNYLLSVTPVEDSNPFAGFSGLLLVEYLVESNLYDIAFDILKRHPEMNIDISFRKEILERLAIKPKGFASGSRLGYWKRLIYHYIPVQEEDFDDSSQTHDNDLPPHGDTENPVRRSQSSSTVTSPSRFLHKLSSTFGARNQKLRTVLWNVLLHLAPSVRSIRETKLMHKKTVEIVRMMCDFTWRFEQASQALKMPILTAARLGIPEIVKEIIWAYPRSVVFVDEHGNNALMLAVIHRQENIIKFVSKTSGKKLFQGLDAGQNKNRNNILHLAATLAPVREVPGAALQMQRELQWFQAVENHVRPSICEERNKDGKTPRELFSEQHMELIEKGEKWMKDNASSCALVASLIITVVFAAAFALPGGNDDQDGTPHFLRKLPFKIFVVSDAISLFSSTTSLLMFLGILTSRYSEEDFLVSLPKKLIIGLITLFISIASMTVAFDATIYMVSKAWKWVFIPVALIGCIPVTLFARLQFPLLVQIYSSTFAPTIFQPLKDINLYI